jgi:hypothetical protein
MSQNISVYNSNVVIGRNSNSPVDLSDNNNIIIGNDKTQYPVDGEPRFANTGGAIVIGSGDIIGTDVTGPLTVVPDGCIMIGTAGRVPTDGTGLPLPDTANHLIFDNLVSEEAGAPTPNVKLFIWYNGFRYAIPAEGLP